MKKLCFLLFAIATFFQVPQAKGAEWISIGKDIFGNELYYDREILIKRSADIVEVWMKGVYSDEGRKQRIQERIKSKATVESYEKLNYVLELQQINCDKRMYRIMEYADYSSDGGILYKFIVDQQPLEGWERIAPGSIGEQMHKTVCPRRGSR